MRGLASLARPRSLRSELSIAGVPRRSARPTGALDPRTPRSPGVNPGSLVSTAIPPAADSASRFGAPRCPHETASPTPRPGPRAGSPRSREPRPLAPARRIESPPPGVGYGFKAEDPAEPNGSCWDLASGWVVVNSAPRAARAMAPEGAGTGRAWVGEDPAPKVGGAITPGSAVGSLAEASRAQRASTATLGEKEKRCHAVEKGRRPRTRWAKESRHAVTTNKATARSPRGKSLALRVPTFVGWRSGWIRGQEHRLETTTQMRRRIRPREDEP